MIKFLQLIYGMFAVLRGVGILCKYQEYKKYAKVSMILNIIFYIVIYWLLFYYILPWLYSFLPAYTSGNILQLVISAFYMLIKILIAASILVISILSFNVLYFIVASPYLDELSLKLEKKFFNFSPSKENCIDKVRNYSFSFLNEIRLNIVAIIWMIILFPLNFIIPVIGYIPATLVGAYYLGLSFINFSAEHRHYTRKEFKTIIKGKRAYILGLGLIMNFILLIPFSATLFIPASIIGGTIIYNEKFETY